MEKKKDDYSFFENVFEVVKLIPVGRVTSYGAIAEYLGSKGSARMVGWALISSHIQNKNIPAYRVVNRNGMLTGKQHFATPNAMQENLEREGIKVENDQVVDFKNLFWDPRKELA
ncbi:MGMT family protein [Adhaeribacter aquaticus]|uniref:MGMT family protein n=1 Tax=Adhaeribacter aquaticus TaxID=299567 RepID=UPI000413991F|nr:MGMT family protein [Adhaeribacter aquaticus]